jgi:hypothetical protein
VEWESFRFVKSPVRAVEKAVTCYGGDVSSVTDICRGRIVFDGVADLAACLELLRGDPVVRIVWLRNGYSGLYDVGAGGGFRVRGSFLHSRRFMGVEVARDLFLEACPAGHYTTIQLTCGSKLLPCKSSYSPHSLCTTVERLSLPLYRI